MDRKQHRKALEAANGEDWWDRNSNTVLVTLLIGMVIAEVILAVTVYASR